MAEKPLPRPTVLRQLLRYEPETGRLFWRHRRRELFTNDRTFNMWNSRFAGTQAGSKTDRGYIHCRLTLDGVETGFFAHRIAYAMHYDAHPVGHIDHINGVISDNRITNLRDVPAATNWRNCKTPRNNKSGVNGVCLDKLSGKWRAYINAHGKAITLGRFINIEDAIAARAEADKKFGYHKNHGRIMSAFGIDAAAMKEGKDA